jgi:hypothetical protein
VYHLLLFFHLRPANQPTVTGVALCRKKKKLDARGLEYGSISARVVLAGAEDGCMWQGWNRLTEQDRNA